MKTLTAEEASDRASKAYGRLVQNEPHAAMAILESVIFASDMPSAETLEVLAAGDHARADAEATALAFNRHIDRSWNAAIEAAAQAMGDDRTLLYGNEAAHRIRALKREAKP